MSYVDGFVIPIKTKNVSVYKKMAQEGCQIWMKHGALQYFECVGEDLNPDMGKDEQGKPFKMMTFPKLAKAKKDETIVFSFIVYKSRKHRDEVNKIVMKEMNELYKGKNMPMPFEMKRMTYGGFKVIVEG